MASQSLTRWQYSQGLEKVLREGIRTDVIGSEVFDIRSLFFVGRFGLEGFGRDWGAQASAALIEPKCLRDPSV